jgi:hypothetical protein
MKKEKKETLLQMLYQYLNMKYGVTLEEVKKATEHVGLVRGHLDTYFMVDAYQRKKQQENSVRS